MSHCLRGAPDVGAFYYEDAVKAINEQGFVLGSVEFARQPRHFTEPQPRPSDGLPQKKYRVLRCYAEYRRGPGKPVCGLLLVKENEH